MSFGDKIPTGSIEMPPNKAVAGAGGATLASAIVGLGLHYFAPDTPMDITVLWMVVANAIITPIVVYFTPHGAVLKE